MYFSMFYFTVALMLCSHCQEEDAVFQPLAVCHFLTPCLGLVILAQHKPCHIWLYGKRLRSTGCSDGVLQRQICSGAAPEAVNHQTAPSEAAGTAFNIF